MIINRLPRRMRNVAILLLLAVLVLLNRMQREIPLTPLEGGSTVTIVDVIDGDTLRDSEGRKLRLKGIDCPELKRGANSPAEPFAKEAKAFATEHLLNKTVLVQFEKGVVERDRYDRYLVFLSVDGEDFNALLLRAGLAELFRRDPFSRYDAYHQLEQEARDRQVGMWKK